MRYSNPGPRNCSQAQVLKTRESCQQPSAIVTKTTQGSAGDLATGETVTVIGQRQADGSVSATTISIQPARGQ